MRFALRGRPTAFLAGLENQFDRAVQAGGVLLKDFRRAQQHRRVGVVPAGVHTAVGRGKGSPVSSTMARAFQIGAQGEDLSRLLPLDQADDAVFADALSIGNPQFVQFAAQIRLGLRRIDARLRNPVQGATPLDEAALQSLRFLFDLVQHLRQPICASSARSEPFPPAWRFRSR